MTMQKPLLRRVSTVAGIAAIAAMGFFTASCAKEEEKAPDDHHDHHDDAVVQRTGCADGERPPPRAGRAEPVLAERRCATTGHAGSGHHSLPGHH